MKERPVSRKSIVKLIILLVLLMVFLASNGIYKWKEQPATSPTAGPIEQDKQTQKPDQGNDNEDKDENINDLHPIAFKDLLMGGSQKGSWISAEDLQGKISEDDSFTLYSNEGLIKTSKGAKISESLATGAILFSFDDGIDSDDYLIAISAAFDPLAQKVSQIEDTSSYEPLVDRILEDKKISAKAEITRAYKVDLEGNGKERVFVKAANVKGLDLFEGKDNSYSFIFSVSDGQDQSYQILSGYFNSPDTENELALDHSIFAFADLNGDGKLEIAAQQSYYEGVRYTIYEYKDGNYIEVLSVFDGV